VRPEILLDEDHAGPAREVLAMEEGREVLGQAEPMSAEAREAGMRAKSAEFLAEGGKLYVDAAE
jgi:phosphomethylpyrimidine synthase